MRLTFEDLTPSKFKEKAVEIFHKIDAGAKIVESHVVLLNASITDLDFWSSTLEYMTAVETKLDSCNLNHADLSRLNYADGIIKDSTFFSAILVKAEIYACVLERVSFVGCNLNRSEFTDVIFDDVSFENSSLIGASFDNCDLRGVNFKRALFDGTHFFGCILDDEIKSLPGVILKAAI